MGCINVAQLEVVAMTGPQARRERERAAEAARLGGVSGSRAAEDRASEAYIAEKTKPCPRCGAPSVKIDGCKHIEECCRCKHEYCWDCGRSWVVGHMSVACAPP